MVSASVVTIRGCETFGCGTHNIISSKTANRLEDRPFNVFMLVMPSSLRRKQKSQVSHIYKKKYNMIHHIIIGGFIDVYIVVRFVWF